MAAKNIFVFGLDDLHLAQLRTIGTPGELAFHELYQHPDVKPYEIAVLFIGGDSERDLQEKNAFCQESLHLHLHLLG